MFSKDNLISALFKLNKSVLDEAEQVLAEWDDIFSKPDTKESLTEEQVTKLTEILHLANTYGDEVLIYALAKIIGGVNET